MDRQCRATKQNGERCKGTATSSDGLCWAHAPENAAKRQRITSRAGRARLNRELVDIKSRLSQLTDDVLEGRVDRGRGAIAAQILNVLLRAISVELKVREQEELEREVAELREYLERGAGRGYYG